MNFKKNTMNISICTYLLGNTTFIYSFKINTISGRIYASYRKDRDWFFI